MSGDIGQCGRESTALHFDYYSTTKKTATPLKEASSPKRPQITPSCVVTGVHATACAAITTLRSRTRCFQNSGTNQDRPKLFRVGCAGRITQLAEAGDGRYILELTGIARFKVVEEISALTAYRQCKVDYFPYIDDFTARKGEEAVDREALLEVLTDFLKANNLKVDWEGVESAPNEALVNALAMMSPYGPPEKQAMLEAPDLKTRAEILIAVTEMDLAKKRTSGDPPLQ